MIAKLEFNLDDPDDRAAHKRTVQAFDLYCVVCDFDNYLRGLIKYDETLSEEVVEQLDRVRTELYDLLECSGVNLHE